MFMCPISLTQMSLATLSLQFGQFWSLRESIHAGVVPLKDDDSETDPLQDSPPSSTIKSLGSSFKHVSVTPTPRPRTRKPKRISMNAGEYCKCCSVHVCVLCYLYPGNGCCQHLS